MFAKKEEAAFKEEVWKQAHILAAQTKGWDIKKGNGPYRENLKAGMDSKLRTQKIERLDFQ